MVSHTAVRTERLIMFLQDGEERSLLAAAGVVARVFVPNRLALVSNDARSFTSAVSYVPLTEARWCGIP